MNTKQAISLPPSLIPTESLLDSIVMISDHKSKLLNYGTNEVVQD